VGLPDAVARGIARVSLLSSRHAKTTLAIALVASLTLGYGVSLVTTDVNVADVLPRGNYNTEAAHKLSRDFRSTFTQQVTFQVHVDNATGYANWVRDNAKLPNRGELPEQQGGGIQIPGVGPLPTPVPVAPNPDRTNITDEVYVRAMDEMVRFIQSRTDFNRTISIAGLYELINWTVAGGYGRAPDASYRLPPPDTQEGARRYNLVDGVVKGAILDAVDALASPSWTHTAVLFTPAADNTEHTRILGESILRARDAYVRAVADGNTTYTVFGPDNPPLVTVDLPVANAHSSRLVREDIVRLVPVIAAFIVACLWVAFRNARAIVISFTSLALGVVWTYGVMGYMGIPLNTLNMVIVPLVMGVGIDYAIHMINEFSEHKAEGLTDEDAFRRAGKRAGLAMLIATLTTVAGLLAMVLSPSVLIGQLGLLSAVAIASIYVLTLTFIPAALTLLGTRGLGQSFSHSRAMPALGRFVTRIRWPALGVVLAVTVAAYASSLDLKPEAFGDPGKNYPEGDPIRREHELGLEYFYEIPNPDVKANILTFEGPGILSDASIQYMRLIEGNLKAKDRVIPDTLRTLPFFIETWLTVKGGAEGAAQQVVIEQILNRGGPRQLDNFPKGDAIRKEVDAMFDSPFRQLASIIINHPTNDMAAMTFSVKAATFEEAAQVWGQVWDAVAKANASLGGAPEGVRVAFVGNTATNYLFIAEELPWLTYMGLASNGVLLLLAAVFLRTWRSVATVMLLSLVTTAWWLGLLPHLGIGLAITLTLPLVFISAIGTDYAVHLVQNMHQLQNARRVLQTTGKAVVFSTVTTIGAFVIFILIQNVAVSRTMVATSAAIALIFAATMLVVPSFYPVLRKGLAQTSGAFPVAAGDGSTGAGQARVAKATESPGRQLQSPGPESGPTPRARKQADRPNDPPGSQRPATGGEQGEARAKKPRAGKGSPAGKQPPAKRKPTSGKDSPTRAKPTAAKKQPPRKKPPTRQPREGEE
jgi:uncharacterized protein